MKLYHFIFLFFVLVSCKKTNQNLIKITAKTTELDSSIVANEAFEKVISPYKEKLSSEMNAVLCYAPRNFVKNDGNLQSSLGNLMADLCYEIANPMFKEKTNATIDFAMFNSGGLRAPITKGNVITENAFKLMPFDNEFVVVELSGDKMEELISYFIRNKKAHPLSKNTSFLIKENDYDLKINGKKFDKNKTYKVLTSDYLQSGGDRMNFFKNPLQLTKLNYKVRDAVIDYFKKVDTLKTTIDKRIIVE
ncbi:5'-nucleotidase C-terminal domain-containing protein [Polaribacter porphyrae]|uniref:UDP-sugar hydrolase n=1 Tax=Polaribacter porphyrae TaxID=1137780 RepID=A0A2S7WKW2_9FLAO|nr:5'-nucleotidase [Polaribacter porphyrae]PQJ78244.1 UDP-sugar hydrolase [Polaribacter porphyrae]